MNLFVLKAWLESKLGKNERGANLVEYILLIALIAVVGSFLLIFGIVFIAVRARNQKSQMLHQERMLALEKGLPVPQDALDRDWSQPYVASTGVEDAWLIVFPGIAISLTVLSVFLLADGLRDAMDPRLRR